jgi:hypothetical protein
MCEFNRDDICAAYAMYAILWGGDGCAVENAIAARLRRIGFRLSCNARLETMERNAKEIYGGIVRANHRLLVGYERLYRRQSSIGGWPGTRNIPGGDVRRYLASRGILAAVESMVQA